MFSVADEDTAKISVTKNNKYILRNIHRRMESKILHAFKDNEKESYYRILSTRIWFMRFNVPKRLRL